MGAVKQLDDIVYMNTKALSWFGEILLQLTRVYVLRILNETCLISELLRPRRMRSS